ncbi:MULTISPECIES: hypothetical protein [unclassified Variovorax]|uniref:hypothetical protein n=1 Tax=unclassified Variovorax TaxID=663243 RepID=UPI00076C5575|nr:MULTISPECIES: hypothetical protein [unclassified Variovorax]KWT98318.1 hypothetical protein APY03_0453 [Variovorax sp. WDL1]PNG50027.1 hypothetical protein CHC06_05608 [Variovorax sp. B2]PNG50899.1 hypothetical protein CHC07_05513 [Variovorax sp. B4]VTV17051.1 hypothetical protein WDL1P1_00021 [Variovorax sp. WDL1]
MTTATESRLEELLDLKDVELEEAEERIRTLEREIDFGVDWMRHEPLPRDESGLPLPRIELRVIPNTHYCFEAEVTLALAQRDGSVRFVPLSYSKVSGRALDLEQFPTSGVLPDRQISDLPGLVNDACFHMDKTGIGAFVVLDDRRRYRITSLRPLAMKAVA